MKSYNKSDPMEASWIFGLLILLALMVACGTSAPATSTARPPAATGAPATGSTGVPAAAPTATTVPAALFSPGKVVMMQTVWGTQAFEPRYTLGLGETTYIRALHANLIEGNRDAQLIPGILTKWEVSTDGKTWAVTVGKGAKFHNGDDLTIDDVYFTMERYHGKEAETGATNTGAIQFAKDTEKTEIAGPNTIKVTHKSLCEKSFQVGLSRRSMR